MKQLIKVGVWFALAVALAMLPFATALAADRNTQSRQAYEKAYGVAATTQIYKGSMVCLSATGYLVPAADTAGLSAVVGVADENVLGTTDGALDCRVVSGRAFRLAASSITVAMQGDTMYVVDDQTVDDAVGSANGIVAGTLLERVSATDAWVFIPHGGSAPAVEGARAVGGLQYRDVQLTAAQVNALVATNIEMVPAPGAGLAVLPVMVHMFLDHGGTDFVQTNGTDHLALLYSGSTELFEIATEAQLTTFIEASADAALAYEFGNAAAAAGLVPEANAAIDLDNNGAAEYATGDGTLSIRVYYITVPMAAFA